MFNIQKQLERRAYVTLLSDDSYLQGVITLHFSLMQTYPAYDFLVLINTQVSEHTRSVLTHCKIAYKTCPSLAYTEQSNTHMNTAGWPAQLNNTADKLSVFTLSEYDKMVYIDADMLVLKNIDFLFNYPHGSAAIDVGIIFTPNTQPGHSDEHYQYIQGFNSGLFVFQPNSKDHQKCLELMQCTMGFDQEILRALWHDWKQSSQRHLPPTCNVFAAHLTEYIRQGIFGFTDVHILHFTYQPKPWQKTNYQIDSTRDFIYYYYQEYMYKSRIHHQLIQNKK